MASQSAPGERLLYGKDFWTGKIGNQYQKSSLTERLHLVISLMAFLTIGVAQFLQFLFESNIPEVKQRAGMFMYYRAGATTEDARFPPGMLYRLWHERWPEQRGRLHDVVKPCGREIILEESDQVITDTDLQIKVKNLTIASIREYLDPQRLSEKYKTLAPYTWELLEAFSSAPNTYRKAKARKAQKQAESSTATTIVDDSEPESDDDEDPNCDDVDPSRIIPMPEGFRRNPLFAVIVCISILAFVRNSSTNLLQVIFGLFLKVNGTSTRTVQVLSNIGLSVSGRTVERIKEIITKDAIAQAISLVLSGKLFYVIFDNINIYLRKHQERLTNKNQMIHATNVAIIAIDEEGLDTKKAEDLEEKKRLRGKRSAAQFRDLVPTQSDDEHMLSAFESHIALFITKYCPGSAEWKGRSEMVTQLEATVPSARLTSFGAALSICFNCRSGRMKDGEINITKIVHRMYGNLYASYDLNILTWPTWPLVNL